ncbi:MAG: tetratricopeptide repeat protein [Geothrix sp.]|uniref:tetratricopeptide repeat protein n=1 Tax=Geothrix sp. TaxID=1962974 RepID=UPI0017AD47ED|nr:tetratricopeptide repeat protein [Geothrix sp.]NWJ41195.1 tetratricopeptide repeat protein [Geothrix sp.]WIL20814.1 MAG: tetratricopeptide repeat protein [Geothrix sp.]
MRLQLLPLTALVCLQAQVPAPSFFLETPEQVAQACAEKALALKPKSVEVLTCLGQIQAAKGELKKAEDCFTRTERLKGGDAETYRLIAQAWIRAGRRDQVRGIVDKAMTRTSRDAGDLADFATVLLDSGFPDEARAMMDQAFKVSPRRTGNFVDFGAALLRAGQPKEAAIWFDRATAANPAKVGTYRDIALACADHARKADLPELKARMLAATEIGFYGTDKDNEAMAARARINLAAGQRAEAEALFLAIMKSKEVHAESFQLIGQAWLRAGFQAEAFRAYEVLPSARGEGGVVGFGSRGTDVSGRSWGPLVSVDLSRINKKRALSDAAVDLAAAGHFDKAMPLMEEVFLSDAKDQNELAKFGRMALEAGRREDAARFFQKAIQADPKDWEVWLLVAQAHADAILRRASTTAVTLLP